jgi:tetratricopeptide (TPR) repeat protein
MQKRLTEDAVHVVMTDHLIRRQPLTGDLLAPLPEQHERVSGKVKLLYPRELPVSSETSLYLAMAEGNPETLQQAIAKAKPLHIEPYFALAQAFQTSNRELDAIRAFRLVIEKFPNDPRAYIAASELMVRQGQVDSAIKLVEPAVSRIPNHAALLNSLAVLYAHKQRFDDALGLLSRAVQLQPDDPLSWLNLGVCLEAKRDLKGAAAAYRQTLVLDAGSARARSYLARLSGQTR